MLCIGIVAGEPSGDYLAADLIRAIRQRIPDVRFEGIGGPQMQTEGCSILFPMEKLAVMGLSEVAGRYFELLGIRNNLIKHFQSNLPDIFIGVDAPDFNLSLEASLHAQGVKTVHYVSPSVWAWRSYRIKKIKRTVDLMLVLFPFEQQIYKQHGIAVEFVGHTLADQIKPGHDKAIVRKNLGLPLTGKLIAIMPGSRKTELDKMLSVYFETARWCSEQCADLVFITSVLSKEAVQLVDSVRHSAGFGSVHLHVFQNRSHEVLAAADVALLTSGTITLEAMLFSLPMVVAYRVNWLTYYIFRALVKVKFASLPNLLADKALVAEFLQADCQPEKMGAELLRLLDDTTHTDVLKQQFESISKSLQRDSGTRAASAVLSLLDKS